MEEDNDSTDRESLEITVSNDEFQEGEEESESEEGEINESMSQKSVQSDLDNSDLDLEIEKALEEGDSDRAQVLLDEKERRCKELKEELKKETDKEAVLRKKKIQQMAARFKSLKRTEDSLNKTLAGSRASTPSSSPPKRSPRRTVATVRKKMGESNKLKRGKGGGHGGKKARTSLSTTQSRSEYNNFISNLLDLKAGKNDQFNELLCKAMQVNENMSGNLNEKVGQAQPSGKKGEEGTAWQINELIQAIKDVRLVNSAQGKREGDNRQEVDNEDKETELTHVQTGQTTTESNTGKKLVSGKCAKPDDTDIKVVVKFAHEKLDPRHVQDRQFEKLNFVQLVAGELELATRAGIHEDEQKARTNLAKVICYHKQYLHDADLRSGYDHVLKQVEQKLLNWTDDLGDHLHQFYDYRAMALLREKIQQQARQEGGNATGAGVKMERKSLEKSENMTAQEDTDSLPKPVFCMEFNQGTCKQTDTHEGHFGGKRCLKWHICRRCRRIGDIRHHAEKDCTRK